MTTDIFQEGYQAYLDCLANIPRQVFFGFLRAPLLIGLPGLVCALMFQRLRRQLPNGMVLAINWTVMVLGAFVILGLPLDQVPLGRAEAGFVFGVALLGLVVAPWAVSFFLATRQGYRRLLAIIFYVTMVALLVIQVLIA